ncbi:hypothetical protein ABPG72_004802 [Tetrahymena utriculariae]
MSVIFEVEDHFQLAVLSAIIYSFQMILIGFVVPGKVRGKIFTEEFMRENFGKEHLENTGLPVDKSQGYPDMGHGRYSDKLPYEKWLQFAKSQRVHYNFLENWGPQTLFIVVGALKFPIFSAVLGFIAILGRLLYTVGYMFPQGSSNFIRMFGAITGDIVMLISFILSFITCVNAYYN